MIFRSEGRKHLNLHWETVQTRLCERIRTPDGCRCVCRITKKKYAIDRFL